MATRDNEGVPIVRQVSANAAASIAAAVIMAVLGNSLMMRDTLRDNTSAAKDNAIATKDLTVAVHELQARFAAKDLKDAQQDFRLDNDEKRITGLENQKPLRLR